MGWLIVTIVLAVPIGIGVAMLLWGPGSTEPDTEKFGAKGTIGAKIPGAALVVVCGLIWLLITGFSMGNTLSTGQAALIYDFSGKLASKRVEPGIIWTAPWQHVRKVDVFLQTKTFTLGENSSAVSKDQQAIFAEIALNYEVGAEGVLDLYTTVGPAWEQKLIDSRVLQDFKEVTSKYTAQEITTRRESLRRETLARLQTEFEKYPAIVVKDFFVRNLHYSNAYEQSISEKNVQVQQALQAQAKVEQSKAEANQVAAAAEGEARATVARATAEAKALRLKGQALRANPEILKLEAIDKLNPKAAVVICTGTGDGNCPSFLPGSLTGG